MYDLAVREHITAEALDELMDSDIDLARRAVDHFERIDVGIELVPLASPIGTNLFFSDDAPAFLCLWPADAVTHQHKGAIDVALIEGTVDRGDECLCVCQKDPPGCWEMQAMVRCGRGAACE